MTLILTKTYRQRYTVYYLFRPQYIASEWTRVYYCLICSSRRSLNSKDHSLKQLARNQQSALAHFQIFQREHREGVESRNKRIQDVNGWPSCKAS